MGIYRINHVLLHLMPMIKEVPVQGRRRALLILLSFSRSLKYLLVNCEFHTVWDLKNLCYSPFHSDVTAFRAGEGALFVHILYGCKLIKPGVGSAFGLVGLVSSTLVGVYLLASKPDSWTPGSIPAISETGMSVCWKGGGAKTAS